MTPEHNILIYTDLDGTLLDHHDYGHAAADELLDELERESIPVIFVSSKTFAELLPLRRELGNRNPFMTENGAALYIPRGYFPGKPAESEDHDDYWRLSFSRPRADWLELLARVASDFRDDYTAFSSMSIAAIRELTGLDEAAARNAAEREFGEPLLWRGNDGDRLHFVDIMHNNGARVLQGGRFLHLGGDCDKGVALRRLNRCYAAWSEAGEPLSIALGDSQNDVAMLDAADYAVIVRSPAHPPPSLSRRKRTLVTNSCGPAGWVQGVRQTLSELLVNSGN